MSPIFTNTCALLAILLIPALSYAQVSNNITKTKEDEMSIIRTTQKGSVFFIDKFFVPAASIQEFRERGRLNMGFLRTLPGFIDDAAYEYSDSSGNLICVTVAQWTDRAAIDHAREALLADYKTKGFDAAEMFKRLHIVVDRGIYTAVEN